MSLKFNEVVATYLLLSCKKPQLKGWTITVRLLPSADSTNSCNPSSSCKLQPRIPANPKLQSCSKPVIPIFNFYSARGNQQPVKDQEPGWKANSTHPQKAASSLASLEMKTILPPQSPEWPWASPPPTQQQQ